MILLPRLQGTVEPTLPPPSTQPTAARRRRILLAEDHDLVRASAMRVPQRGGHEVTAVSDGREALALIEAGESFDLIVSDVEMPELGGRQLVAALDARAVHVPTVLMSGQAEPPLELSGVMAGRVQFS